MSEEIEYINKYLTEKYSIHAPTIAQFQSYNIPCHQHKDSYTSLRSILRARKGKEHVGIWELEGDLEHIVSLTAGVKAYEVAENNIVICVHLGVGSMVSRHVLEILHKICEPSFWFFGGCALSLSSHVHKGDVISIASAFAYENDTLDRGVIQKVVTGMEEKEGIALSANIFVDVRARYHAFAGSRTSLSSPLPFPELYEKTLPSSAWTYVNAIVQCMEKEGREEIPLVLDMETYTFMDVLRGYESTRYEVIRVVLDSIYDVSPINFRKDMMMISKIIADEMLLFYKNNVGYAL